MRNVSVGNILSLYEWDLGIGRFASCLRRMPKITEEHVNLNPALRIRVYLAAQVKKYILGNYV